CSAWDSSLTTLF
nr:immunoglobulin light chain junction region [Macaca mulatta]MPN65246.1 immunoglobulin light chain junction region [Macaca mulatta]MPN65313.1 immunoglobulin light chain junction region [Macaca mulatta]MPN65391.1 immunoglobulin light chain junction region [Macaca mulatta]MPN65460.1 immunoglobulin light chain junction region [Macaca mulatta]